MSDIQVTEKGKVRKEDIIKFYLYIKHEADTYYKNFVETEWRRNIALYEDKYDFGSYKPDQESVKLPVADNMVKRLTSIFKSALINLDGEYFTIENLPESLAFSAKGSESIVDYTLEDNSFPKMFGRSMEFALVTSPLCFKVYHETDVLRYYDKDENNEPIERNELVGKVKIKDLDPRNIRLDPREESDNYIQEIVCVPMHEFKELARLNDWNEEEVAKLCEAKDMKYQTYDNWGHKIYSEQESYNPDVTFRIVYAKCVYNAEGEEILKDVKFIVGEDEYLLDICYNELPFGKFPYIYGTPMGDQQKKYPRGYLSKLCSLILTYIESIDLMMTQYRLNVWGLWGYDPNAVPGKAAHNFNKTIRPGTFYPNPTMNNVYQNTAGLQSGLQVQGLFDQLMQILSYQNEFVQGRASTHSRTTAFEIRQKTDQAQGFFNDIAIELEDQIINPLIEMVLMISFLHWDDSDFTAKEFMINDPNHLSAINNLSYSDRIKMLTNGQIRARGMSGRIRRAAMFDKIALLFEIGAQYPPLIQSVPTEKIHKTFFESIGENAKDWQMEKTTKTENQQPQGTEGLTEEDLNNILSQQEGMQ